MDAAATFRPAAPRTPEETGLPRGFLVELVAKSMIGSGRDRLADLARHLALPVSVVDAVCRFMREENLLEVVRRGSHDGDIQFQLTEAGHARTLEWMARNRYAGPAPVTLEAYARSVATQAASRQHVTRAIVQAAFSDLVVPDGLADQVGIAVNSARPILLHGPAGSGKTWIAAQLTRLLDGPVAIPHAIHVDGEIIRVFDEQWHRPIGAHAAEGLLSRLGDEGLDNASRIDARWVACERPLIIAGGELTLSMLELAFDERAGFYEAPPHFKANGGVFVIDDLGRQVISPRELMNRWIVPMDRRIDYLMMRSGTKFTLPFDMVLAFCGNLGPQDLADDAFLRRIGHKIHVGPLLVADYRRIFERQCAIDGIAFVPAAFDRLLRDRHAALGRPPLACHPRDLLAQITSRAAYLEVEPSLSDEMVDWAWTACFGEDAAPGPEGVSGRPASTRME